MIRLLLLIILLVCFQNHTQATDKKVVIYGHAPSYANDEIVLLKYANYISKQEISLDTAQVDSTGSFRLSFSLSSITRVFTHLGIYNCYLYAEPGNQYEVILPEKVEKKHAQKLNPFFEETEVHLAVKNFERDDLNFSIRSFNQSYLPYYNKHVYDVFVRHNFDDLDSAITSIQKPFEEIEHQYFRIYTRYKLARLRYLAYQRKSKRISDQFFLNQKVWYQNDAYMELFNKVYDNYFTFFGRTEEGKTIYSDISEDKSLSALKNTLDTDDVLSNDTLKEFVILKCIHDEFYEDNFSRSALLTILDSLQMTTKIPTHKETALEIRKKITRLLPGHAPPSFALYDRDSSLIRLSDFEGDYVYLNFCSCQSYSCINEFNILEEFQSRHKQHVTIVTVAVDEKFNTMTRFLERFPFEWKFLHYANQPDILEKYDIRGFPTYFLISPEGKLLLSPAPSPSEGFGEQLFYIMKNRKDL